MSNAGSTYQPIFRLNDEPLSTTRKIHIRRLNDILHLSLERGDMPRARRAWAILSRCKEFDWRTKWRTGLQVISSSPPSSQSQQPHRRSIDYLKKLMRFNPDKQESILQEIILHLADSGKFREALDELDLYLPSFPFQENPTLHTYAGLITLKLSALSTSDEGGQSMSASILLQDAKKHFIRALSIDPDNTVAKSFVKEVTKRLETSDIEATQHPDDAPSDEEMEIDQNDPLTRGKRVKRTNSND